MTTTAAPSVGGEIVTPPARRRQWPRVLGWTALAGAVLVAGLGLAVHLGARHVTAVAAGRSYAAADVPVRGVAMVLGAKADRGGPSGFLAARLDLAVTLFMDGRIRAVLVSGDGRASSNDEPGTMKTYLVERGVPADKIVEDPAGFDTYDSCVRARDVFGVREMTIITQAYHLDRAITICTDIGVDAIGVGDLTVKERFPGLYAKGERREWAANLKMEWDLGTRRVPQQDPFDPSLLDAARA